MFRFYIPFGLQHQASTFPHSYRVGSFQIPALLPGIYNGYTLSNTIFNKELLGLFNRFNSVEYDSRKAMQIHSERLLCLKEQ